VEQLVARWDHSPKVIRSSRISATIVGVAALFLPSMWRMGIKGEYGKWQTWCMRRTENPVKVIRFHLFPQNLYGVVQFPQVR
jgi:hypothetical protein